MATVRGSAKVTSNTSVGQIDIVVPAPSQASDVAVLIHSYNPATQDSPMTGSGGTGWTLLGTFNYSASFRVRAYKKVLAAPDVGTTVSFTNTTLQRMAASMVVLAGVTDVDVFAALNETTSQATHPGATTAALTASGVGLAFLCERSNAPSTAVTSVPSGFTAEAGATGFATGNGSCSVAAAVKLTSTTTGNTLGGGSWVMSNANSGVITLAIAVTESAPISQVGRTLSTTWHDRQMVGNGFTGDVSELFEVAGQVNTWAISDISVAGRSVSTTWKIGEFVGRTYSTTWNVEELPVDPGPGPGPDPDPSELTKRIVFPTYQVAAGRLMPFSRFLVDRPSSLVKANGEWLVITSPSQELLEAAENYFIGGYTYLLTEAEAAALGLPPQYVEDVP